jgi:hypothetical protein
MVVATIAFSAQAYGQNLLVNPGFEAGGGSFGGWEVFGEAPTISTPANDDIYRTGEASAKIYGEFTNCSGYHVGSGFFQEFTPTPGMEYKMSGYSFVSEADTIPGSDTCFGNRCIAKVVFFNSFGFEVSANEVIIGDWSTPRNEWVPFTVTAPVPETAVSVQAMILFLQWECNEGAVFVDDTEFVEVTPTTEPNVLANPSFDFDLSGWNAFGNAYYDGRDWALRTTTGAAKLYGTFVEGNDSGMFQQFPADPGSIWKFDAYTLTTCRESPIQPGNGCILLAKLLFKDAAGNGTGASEAVIVDQTSPLGKWTRHSLYGTAPAGTDSVAAYILFVQSFPEEQGAAFIDDVLLYDISTVGIDEGEVGGLTLHQNVPNPFNPTTRIAFELPRTQEVEIFVYNVAGRRVVTLHDGVLPAGPHAVTWDGRTADGSMAASGTYWYLVSTPDGQSSRSMVLLK